MKPCDATAGGAESNCRNTSVRPSFFSPVLNEQPFVDFKRRPLLRLYNKTGVSRIPSEIVMERTSSLAS